MRIPGAPPAGVASREDSLSYEGWWIAFGAAVAIMVTFGIRASFGTIIEPLEARFGGTRAAISTIAAVNLLLYGLVQPLVGNLVDRDGGRFVLAAGLLLTGAGVTVTALGTELWHVYLGYGVITSLGISLATPVTVSAAVSPWFDARRGLAIGIANAGSPIGQLVFVPVAMGLVLAFGITWGYGALGAGIMLIGFPLVLWLLSSRPHTSTPDVATPSSSSDDTPERTGIATAARTGTYWLLAFGMLVCGFTSAGVVITHLIPLSTQLGMPAMVGAVALSVIGISNFFGVLGTGFLTDKVGRIFPLSVLFMLRGLAHLAIPLAIGPYSFMVASVVYGMTHSATMSTTAAVIGDRFGRRSVGTLYGFMLVGHQVGAALGAFLGGAMFDQFGGYLPVFQVAAALSFSAALTSLLLHPRALLAIAPGVGEQPNQAD